MMLSRSWTRRPVRRTASGGKMRAMKYLMRGL